jgi:hypothetical protein
MPVPTRGFVAVAFASSNRAVEAELEADEDGTARCSHPVFVSNAGQAKRVCVLGVEMGILIIEAWGLVLSLFEFLLRNAPEASCELRVNRLDVTIGRSGQQVKIDIALLNQMDVIITLCGDAEESCPMTPPHIKRMRWPVFDPAKLEGSKETVVDGFRKARDKIKELVLGFIEETRQGS